MRHNQAIPRTCQLHIVAFMTVVLSGLASTGWAQASVNLGFTRQRVSAADRTEGLSGYNLDVAIRLASRLNLLIGGEQMGHGGNSVRDEFTVGLVRTGLQIQAVRSRAAELNFGFGLGLHSISLDREEDGGGATGFIQAQLTIHPFPVVGFTIGGIAQSFSGFGPTIGGNSVGLTLGIQLRGNDW